MFTVCGGKLRSGGGCLRLQQLRRGDLWCGVGPDSVHELQGGHLRKHRGLNGFFELRGMPRYRLHLKAHCSFYHSS